MAQEIEKDLDKLAALAGIIPRLPELQRANVLNNCLEIIFAVQTGHEQIQALAPLMPYLPEQIKAEIMKAVWQVIGAMGDVSMQVKSLALMSPYLQKEMVHAAIELVRKIKDAYWRDTGLAALAPRLAKLGNSQQALIEIRAIETEVFQVTALGYLAPYLDKQLLPEALQMASAIRSDYVVRQDETYSPNAHTISSVVCRAQAAALEYLALYTTPQFKTDLHRIWRELLHQLTENEREKLLINLGIFSTTLTTLGGAEALAEATRAIQDVGRWWL